MITKFFIMVAIFFGGPEGHFADAAPRVYPTIEACDEARGRADAAVPAGKLLVSKCVELIPGAPS